METVIQRDGETYKMPVAMAGTFVSIAVSSFVAELLALEASIEHFRKLVCASSSGESPSKRVRLS